LPKFKISRNVNLQYTAVQTSFWMSYMPMAAFSVVLLEAKGFSSSEIGIILAAQFTASSIAQPLISNFAEGHPHIPLKKIIGTMLLAGGIFFFLLNFLPHLFWPALLIFIVVGVTEASAPSFLNAIAMQLTNAGIPVNYGIARGLGSLSFALSGALLGKLIDRSGVGIIGPFMLGAVLFTCLFLFPMQTPDIPDSSAGKDRDSSAPKTGIWEFLRRNKAYTGFCVASALMITSHTFINTYLPSITEHLGGTVGDQGIIRSIGAFLELPVMLLYSRLARHSSSRGLLVISSFSFFAKTLATMVVPGIGALFAVQILQMPAFALYTPAAVAFSDETASDADRVRAQAISMVAAFGIGNIAGSLGGGFILDTWGLGPMLAAATVIGFLGFLVMAFSLIRKKRA